MKQKTAIIIGAGPAGLTVAYELLKHTDIVPIIYELSEDVGGISKTINYKGNRMDIGGHRFFSKSEKVMNWWKNILPIEDNQIKATKREKIFLVRNRLSRIFYLRKFFDYPVSLNLNTVKNFGLFRMMNIGFSYMKVRLFPLKEEYNLEQFFINRFGEKLYLTFFKDYTEKVWGISCRKIKSEWGAQRIKGLSISKALFHAIRNIFPKENSIEQKNIETSLIEKFLYPKLGPGQLWEEVASIIEKKGGKVFFNKKVEKFKIFDNKIEKIFIKDLDNNEILEKKADFYFSTMPVKDLINGMGESVDLGIRKIANGLLYRDFITVGVLLKKLKIKNSKNENIKDNWIYIQEKDVKIGRLQIFNNWSEYMVKDKKNIWIGLEYFCKEGDELWNKKENEFAKFAIKELEKIGFIEQEDVLDFVVVKMPKTYPAYFGSYDEFHHIQKYLDNYKELFLIGRNGMHKYNNQDHSMLTAMLAVENIKNGITDKKNIWEVNTEQNYHEKK